MSAESLKAFTEKVAADTDLTKRAKSISPNDFPAIIAFAQELGYEVTEQDLTSNNEIADDVLDTIAGGTGAWVSIPLCPNTGAVAIASVGSAPVGSTASTASTGGW